MLLSYHSYNKIEVGCDEAGRGCLAGPVFAAAVILKKNFSNELLNDSKKLTDKQRFLVRPIIEKEAIAFAIAQVDHLTIDKINILNASIMAMHLALNEIIINKEFNHIIVDGNRFKNYQNIKHTTIVKGDGKYASIAAASILAKTYRDDYMIAMHKKYPNYAWEKNMGYPTKKHREGIMQFGPTPFHRMSFTLLKKQTVLDF